MHCLCVIDMPLFASSRPDPGMNFLPDNRNEFQNVLHFAFKPPVFIEIQYPLPAAQTTHWSALDVDAPAPP